MINVTNVVKEFRAADLQAYIQDYTLGELRYKEFFPSMFTPQLTFEALEAEFGAKVAADVVAFDSRSPRKGRNMPGKITGELAKIDVARVKKESDLNTYRMLLASISQATSSGARQQAVQRLISWMYDDAKFVLDGVNARLEWMAKQIASSGKYSLTTANNEAGVQTKVDIDFKIPAGNITNASADWGTAATAKPVTDFKAKQAAARAKGIKLNWAFMDQETLDKMAASEEMQKFTASYAANALGLQLTPSLEAINSSLRGAGLPQVIVWDSYVTVESKAGAHTSVSGWVAGNVSFSVSNILGDTWNTTTADGFVTIDASTKATNDFVLVKSFALQDPITVVTKGVAYATPALRGANNMFILKTTVA